MPFMIPFYSDEPMACLLDACGESRWVPTDCIGPIGTIEEQTETVKGKIFARLSAPGYLDCTEWLGPFDTMPEARAAIVEAFDVCPWCGASYGDEGNGTPDEPETCTCEADAIRAEGLDHA